jgi:hypothetical protein
VGRGRRDGKRERKRERGGGIRVRVRGSESGRGVGGVAGRFCGPTRPTTCRCFRTSWSLSASVERGGAGGETDRQTDRLTD